jgi:hypothetical protein
LDAGFQLKIPVLGSKVAPAGSPEAPKTIVSPGSGSEALDFNVIALPVAAVKGPSTVTTGGLFCVVTVRVKMTVFVTVGLDPVTVTWYEPAVVELVALIVSVEVPDPPRIVAGLKDPDGPELEKETVKATSLLKLLTGVTVIVNELEFPACTERPEGFALIVKSGVGAWVTVTVWPVLPVLLVESWTFNATLKLPAVLYTYVGEFPVPVDPSPKFQEYEYGGVPPDTVPVNVIV